MEKEKRIEEMAKIMLEKAFENFETSGSAEIYTEVRRHSYFAFLEYCEAIYNKGYRKQEDILHEWVERETTYLKEIAELKKELDRLKKFELYRIKAMKEDKDEIERLTEENKQYFAENERLNKSCGIYQIKLEEQIKETYDYVHKADKLKKRNAELQKQVDELKQENSVLSVTIGLQEEIEKQAVKDTAKEIYSEINSCIEKGQEYCGLDWRGLLTAKTLILVYCKKKGVEVE